jgi:membrane-associated PAP2 superfamily phosphatase
MNRTGLIIALAIGILAGLLFGLVPALDLRIASYFYAISDSAHNMFALRLSPVLMTARDVGLWVGTVLIAPAVGALIIKLLLPRRKLLISGRAILFLMATMGPGLLVNVLLKDHWGRPRPIDVTQFGGDQHFVAWWDPRGDCPGNCSFVSGDVAGAFWTVAPAALTPLPWRAAVYTGALALGTVMAVFRMMAGGHFPSDTIFAGVFTFLIIWLCYALIYRWPRTRLSDESIEATLTRVAMPGYNFIVGMLRKKKTEL